MARPKIKAIILGATPQIKLPSSKTAIDARFVHFALCMRKSWPNDRIVPVCVRVKAEAAQPLWLKALNSEARAGKLVARIVCEHLRSVQRVRKAEVAHLIYGDQENAQHHRGHDESQTGAMKMFGIGIGCRRRRGDIGGRRRKCDGRLDGLRVGGRCRILLLGTHVGRYARQGGRVGGHWEDRRRLGEASEVLVVDGRGQRPCRRLQGNGRGQKSARSCTSSTETQDTKQRHYLGRTTDVRVSSRRSDAEAAGVPQTHCNRTQIDLYSMLRHYFATTSESTDGGGSSTFSSVGTSASGTTGLSFSRTSMLRKDRVARSEIPALRESCQLLRVTTTEAIHHGTMTM